MSTNTNNRRSKQSTMSLAGGASAEMPRQHNGSSRKRAALATITNLPPPPPPAAVNVNSLSKSSKLVPCSSKVVSIKKGPSASTSSVAFSGSSAPTSNTSKPSFVTSVKDGGPKRRDVSIPEIIAEPALLAMDISPVHSDAQSESMDESMSMSTCDYVNSPEVEYLDNNQIREVDSIGKRTSNKLCISEHVEVPENVCKREIISEMDTRNEIMDIDNDFMDPQMCATMACDIYKHLRASEAKKRPSNDFMERVQKDINASMRGILIDWLVEVAEEYRLVPDTLYLTVNYIDRYLSGNVMDRQRLQLLGVACMMIASKYEEICAPQVEEFCYITDNTYFKEEILQMETDVLNYLKFEMTAPTTKCFLRRFIRAAQGVNEPQSLQVECLTNYVAELSLLEYGMLRYTPSLIAASSIFVARYILCPSKKPWTSTLLHYTLYRPSDLRECVLALHSLTCGNPNSSLPAIREKYKQHKYKFVAKKHCPPSIPQEYFQDTSN